MMLTMEEDNARIAQAKETMIHLGKALSNSAPIHTKPYVDGEVDFKYCETKEQIADLFTKALDEPKFTYFRDKIMYRPVES